MNDLEKTFKSAERQRERLAALLRVFVFLSLMGVTLSLREHGAHHHPALYVTIAYGVLSTAGVVLAWRRVFHPLLPFAFVTLEVVLVGVQTILMGSVMGQTPMSLVALPSAAVIFVILANAAMRYRPWLVLYAAGLFLAILALAGLTMPDPHGGMPTSSHNIQHDFVHHQIFPAIMIVLTAAILFVTANGTRQLLQASISERLARHRLSRFFSTDIADRLTDHSNGSEWGGAVQPVAILFTDIRGFSPIAEDLSPVELTDLLGEFRTLLAKTIRDHGGVVDKFIGDAVMAVFGFPEHTASSAGKCLACAHAMLERLKVWSEERVRTGQPPIGIGVGIHYGEAFVGVVGKDDLLEFTVIGDTVNIAERVERLSRNFNADIVVSSAFAAAAALDSHSAGWTVAPYQTIAGHSRPIDVLYYSAPAESIDRGRKDVRPRTFAHTEPPG